jgi:serine/threonine-protein kinase
MPPEQARGRWSEIDGRTDLWAVGASMFTLLSGELVHVSETPNEAVAFAATQRARSIATVRSDLHAAVVELVDRALAYEKESRFPDATAMQQAVRDAYQLVQGKDVSEAAPIAMPELLSGPGAAPPPSRIEMTTAPAKSRTTSGVATRMPEIPMVPSRWPLVASVAGVLVVGGLLGAFLGRGDDSEDTPVPTRSEPASSPAATPTPAELAPGTAEPSTNDERTEAFSVDELPEAEDEEPDDMLANAKPPTTSAPTVAPSAIAPVPSEAPSTKRVPIAIPNVVLEDAPQQKPGPAAPVDDPFSKRQ